MRALVRSDSFIDRLAGFGQAPALLSGEEIVSYADLDLLVDETLDRLGDQRRLLLLHGSNTLGSVVTYLAALRGGHPVILVDAARGEQVSEILTRFDPDLVVGPDGWQERRLTSRHDPHPELRLLLSTSGSTGSPKLVRLSATNLQSNAAAIADYLGLTPEDRAMTSLPLAYSYGLSVLHSHLEVGASVVLTERSVIEPELWSLARSHSVTSFAAVPHTFALLNRTSERWYDVPSLRYVTCAGGRLDPAEVRRLAGLGERHGWQLYVMYGQTEATARMAYLHPSQAGAHPDCIGRPVPGGALRVDQPDADGVGELAYSGPNVMMGYAEDVGDLAGEPALTELRTGDLGRQRADGLFQVVGRTSRFAKLLGHRIDLDRLQSALTAFDPTLVCLSDDQRLLVAVTTADPLLVRDAAARLTCLPPGLVSVRRYPALPLLPNGKPDLAALRHLDVLTNPGDLDSADSVGIDLETAYLEGAELEGGDPEAADLVGGELVGADPEAADLMGAVRAAFAEVLGYDRVDPDASFVELGGDSLSFVEMAFRLEKLLGRLPLSWPQLSIRELAGAGGQNLATTTAAVQPPAQPGPAGARPWRRRWVADLDTGLVLRAVAIVMVVLVHLKVTTVHGGAHLLLGVAGYTFARFPLAAIRDSDRIDGLLRSLARLAVPSVLYIGLVAAVDDSYGWTNVVLLNHVLGPPNWTQAWNFWFVEALVGILAVLAILLAVPAVRRLERRHRALLPAVLLALGLLLCADLFGAGATTLQVSRPHLVFWIFALGWLIQVSTGLIGRLLMSGLVLITLHGYFPDNPVRDLAVQAGLLLLIWLPSLPAPRLLAPLLSRLASASLWIYLTHWVVWPPLLDAGVPRAVVVLACLIAGVAANIGVNRLEQAITRLARDGHSRADHSRADHSEGAPPKPVSLPSGSR
ncbi:MAG TPA: AMP-binding protein [Jatrophihabitans sp.]|uniref:AMP-binding protein n=1 Tax=Jatrophihabitans sp. TaxID=1932789 RepID=UPI002EEEB481